MDDGNVAREWTPAPMSTEGKRQNPEEVTDARFAACSFTAAARDARRLEGEGPDARAIG